MLRTCCFNYPRRWLPPLIALLITCFLLSMFFISIEPWQRMRRIELRFALPANSMSVSKTNYRPDTKPQFNQNSTDVTFLLDVKALQNNFPKLKEATRRHSGPLKNRLEQMMLSYLPVISTAQWMPHSPSGKKFTVEEIHAVAKSTVKPGFLVPNIAHFVLPFGDTNLQFHHMVSLLSCLHVMKPHRLLLWYAPDKQPTGQWWERVRRNLTETDFEEKVIMVRRPVPTSVYTVPVHGREHQSDVMRMEAVLVFGGVYMDIDVFVLKPLEPLRKFPCTIGREVPNGLCNGIFMSAPNGTFLAMWHTAYQVFYDGSWVDHSVWLPNTMHPIFPDLCHVEEESMDRPNWTPQEVDWIYGIGKQQNWDWRKKNYAMHLWFRKYGKQHNMEDIKTLDSMFGQMCRYILFGIEFRIPGPAVRS